MSPWLVERTPPTPARLRLVAVPWAGSGAAALLPWAARLGPETELQVVRLPGRESRFREAPVADLAAVVAALVPAVQALRPLPTAVFGYSLGALIGYELTRALYSRGTQIGLLAVGGSAAPHRLPARAAIAGLDDAGFAAAVRKLEGTPAEVFDHPELLQLLLPSLRADFAMIEGYQPLPGPTLGCPISTFSGRTDPELDATSVAAWSDVTTGAVEHHTYDGGHFFLMSPDTELVPDLRADLRRHLTR